MITCTALDTVAGAVASPVADSAVTREALTGTSDALGQPTPSRGCRGQLELLPADAVPLQFRLDERTRRLGLSSVALIKQQLADQLGRRLEREQGSALRKAA
jgi:hypothetical protein